jgi:VanZ family protein
LSGAPSPSSSDAAAAAAARPHGLARWVPVVLWAACISWFSTDAFSAQSTHRYIDPVIRWLLGDLSPEGFRLAHAVIRKTAHFIEYAVLAILVARALTPPHGPAPAGALVRAVVYCTLYAAADELHQVFEPRRGGSLSDVALDAIGAAAGALLLAWWRAGPRRRVAAPLSAPSRARSSGT